MHLWFAPLIFHHDNAPPHRSRLTRNLIAQELKWKQLQHPAYSPDLAPSDYWLFRSMKTFLRNKRFKNDDEVENAIGQYLASKMGTDFYERGIKKLPSRWRLVVKNEGNYFIEWSFDFINYHACNFWLCLWNFIVIKTRLIMSPPGRIIWSNSVNW